MKRIKIKAPVRSLESAKLQVKAGADELYLGFDSGEVCNISYTGRGRKSQWDGEPTHATFEEFQKIVDFAHKNNVNVDFVANMPFLVESERDEFSESFYNYVKKGIDAGVDAVIIADIGAVMMLRERGIDFPIYTSTFMDTVNIGQVEFLKSLGVKRILLPNQMTYQEMKELTEDDSVEYEVFGHFGCAHLNGTCYLLHGIGEDVCIGLPCRAKYNLESSKIHEDSYPFMDAGEDCSICYIPRLMEARIDALKIVGRALSKEFIAATTRIYRNAVDSYMDGKSPQEVKETLLRKYPWWATSYCNNDRCKYGDTKVTAAFV